MLVMPVVATIVCSFLQSVPAVADQPERRQTAPPMRRTLADTPPFPGAARPREILANIQHAIRVMGLNKGSASYEAMLHEPSVRRMLEVTSEVLDDYYVVELSDRSGKLLGIVGMKKSGTLFSSWPAEGTTPQWSVPDLEPVARVLATRFGATRSHYYHVGATNIPGASDPFLPMIAAEGREGRLFIDRSLNVYRETANVPSRPAKDQTGKPQWLHEAAPEGAIYAQTRTGSFRTLQLVGDIRDAVAK